MFHSADFQTPAPRVARREPSSYDYAHYDDRHIDSTGRLWRAVIDQMSVDIHDLKTRISGAGKARDMSPEAIGYGRGVDEHVDLIISVCAIASLIDYRRGGENRLPLGDDDGDARCSRLARKLTAELDDLRETLLPLAETVPSYYRGRRYRAEYARALSTLFLSLDAIPATDAYLRRSIIAYAPISQRSNDPVGDAQAWAEAADASE
ncbi:hypothetical protein E2974_16115 [Paracoccus yeei]|uniref:hypothetical protein n=1 Tax=Paracoccus yeei TaxID=147645 RepID=UPI0037D24E45